MQSDPLESLRDELFKALPPEQSQQLVGGISAVAPTGDGNGYSPDGCTGHSSSFPDP